MSARACETIVGTPRLRDCGEGEDWTRRICLMHIRDADPFLLWMTRPESEWQEYVIARCVLTPNSLRVVL